MSCFSEKIKTCRKALDLSQLELANMLNTTKQVISHYENGNRTPKIDVAQRYAQILNVPVEYLTNDLITLRLWEHPSLVEDYFNANPTTRLHIVALNGIDPRVATDYQQISALNTLAHAKDPQLSADALEVARAYDALSSIVEKNMVRKSLDLPLLTDAKSKIG